MTKKASGKKPAAKRERATVRRSNKRTRAARDDGLTVNRAELNRLLALKHRDPHRLLGAHESNGGVIDRKSTRLNSSHGSISYAVFCLKKKKKTKRKKERKQTNLETKEYQ